MRSVLPIAAAFLILLSAGIAFTQTTPDRNTFDKDGLKFDYPSDWTLTDRSSPDTQHLFLSKPGSMVLMVIVSPREALANSAQFWSMRNSIDQKYFAAIEKNLTGDIGKNEPENPCLDFNGRNVAGKRFKGLYQNRASTGEVYPFAVGNRLLALIYLRTDDESSISDKIWKKMLGSLSLAGSNKDAVGLKFKYDVVDKGPMNGRAVKLVKPGYPLAAKPASGTIRVSIVVDESGDVVSAEAGAGNQYFRAYAADAARKSKFNPTTVCGKGVSVTGTITYDFKVDNHPCETGVPKIRC